MIIVACTFWGISGLFAKALFNVSSSITSMWLTQTRMISAGVILLIISQFKGTVRCRSSIICMMPG